MVSSWFNSRLLKYQFWLKLHFLIKGLEILKIEFVLDLARLIIIRCRYLYLRKYIYMYIIYCIWWIQTKFWKKWNAWQGRLLVYFECTLHLYINYLSFIFEHLHNIHLRIPITSSHLLNIYIVLSYIHLYF
jgi:hypothetical protein